MDLSRFGKWSVIGALVLFTINMGGAWWLAAGAAESVARPLVVEGEESVVSLVVDTSKDASANTFTLLNRMVDAEVQVRAAQNSQTLCVVAMAGGVAMMALGFALFVMGAEGSFKLEGEVKSGGSLMLKSTAPGIFCFFLAAVILMFALHKKVLLSTGDFEVFPDAVTLPERGPLLPDAPSLEID